MGLQHLFAIGVELAIIDRGKALYKRPDIMTFEAKTLEPMDMVVRFENLSSNKLGIQTDLANARSEPKTKSDVLFQLEKGDICHIIAQGGSLQEVNGVTDSWYKVNFNGQQGWVFGHYTTKRRE